MNNINRPLVKSQARELIKGKFFYLFIISMIVAFLTGSSLYVNVGNMNFGSHSTYDNYQDYYDDYDFDDFYDDGNFLQDNPIEDFQFNSAQSSPAVKDMAKPVNSDIGGLLRTMSLGFASIALIVSLIFAPLQVTLSGMYVYFIRRRADEEFQFGKELGGIFKKSFDNSYLNKLVLVVLRNILVGLLCILFIVPGIIFMFSSYFAYQIMIDYPNLKPSEAIKLSKKMVKGNRTELFTLVLSFIPWMLLILVTFGIASIYVTPYMMTTDALYYENFRLRALAEGRITEDDFLSEQEKFAKYSANSDGMNGAYTQPTGTYYSPDMNNSYQQQFNGAYYTPDLNTNPVNRESCTPNEPKNDGYYYAPQQQQPQRPDNNHFYEPQPQPEENQYYQPPVQEDFKSAVESENTDDSTQV